MSENTRSCKLCLEKSKAWYGIEFSYIHNLKSHKLKNPNSRKSYRSLFRYKIEFVKLLFRRIQNIDEQIFWVNLRNKKKILKN